MLYVFNRVMKLWKSHLSYLRIPMDMAIFLWKLSLFLMANGQNLKGVIVSGDTSYGEAYCQAGDKIADEYGVECLYKVENAGEAADIEAMQAILSNV